MSFYLDSSNDSIHKWSIHLCQTFVSNIWSSRFKTKYDLPHCKAYFNITAYLKLKLVRYKTRIKTHILTELLGYLNSKILSYIPTVYQNYNILAILHYFSYLFPNDIIWCNRWKNVSFKFYYVTHKAISSGGTTTRLRPTILFGSVIITINYFIIDFWQQKKKLTIVILNTQSELYSFFKTIMKRLSSYCLLKFFC